MSNASNAGCVTCRTRNKRCDLTRGPNGCRRCDRAGIECGGYLKTVWRVPRLKHSSRGLEQQTNTAYHGHSEHINLDEFLDQSLRLVENGFPTPTINDIGLGVRYLDWPSDILAPHEYTDLASASTITHGQLHTPSVERAYVPSTGRPPISIVQMPTPPAESVSIGTTRTDPDAPMTLGQASLFASIFSLADDTPVLPYAPDFHGIDVMPHQHTEEEQSTDLIHGQTCDSDSQTEPAVNRPTEVESINREHLGHPEYVQVQVFDELALDPEVDSNIIPFVAHSFMLWIHYFMFESTRASRFTGEAIRRGQQFGGESHQKLILVANTALAMSKSTDYDLTHFTNFYTLLVKGVLEARACSDLTREMATKALGSCHELISMACKVESLANVLNLMHLYAPVFRRACPEPSGLVNLPRRLTAPEVSLKYYATFDVLLSTITHRPMSFRYDLELLSAEDEALLHEDDKPGMRWSIGIPARLVVALARINSLLEDYGSFVDQEVVRELEREIKACKPIVSFTPGEDPALSVGRLMVQESWRLAGYVYLYMGLCGANTSDARVIKVQKQFMGLLESVKSRRNPDVFLVTPILILGIATPSAADQSILLSRLWGVSECIKMGTMGNDIVRILNDIWAHTAGRPAVWSDLRTSCLRVIGM